jgi:hypothetical protein
MSKHTSHFVPRQRSDERFVFRAKIRHETARALLIAPEHINLPRAASVWLPRSQVQIVEWADEIGAFTLAIPNWLAVSHGFVRGGGQ